jgi:hypothetical protein
MHRWHMRDDGRAKSANAGDGESTKENYFKDLLHVFLKDLSCVARACL